MDLQESDTTELLNNWLVNPADPMLVSTVAVSRWASLLYGGPLPTNAAGTQSSPNSALRYHTHLLRATWGRLLPASGLGPGSWRIRKMSAEHLLNSLCVFGDSIHCYRSRKWWWWEPVAVIPAEAKMEADPQSTPQRSPILCAFRACHLWDSRTFNSYRSVYWGDLLIRWGMYILCPSVQAQGFSRRSGT